MIERMVPAGRLDGILRCPACGAQLGRANDPAVGYYTHCGVCDVELVMRIEGPAIMVTVRR
jgi:hypothetical protein